MDMTKQETDRLTVMKKAVGSGEYERHMEGMAAGGEQEGDAAE